MDEEDFSRLNFGFLLISFKKTFFPKFELLNSRCSLSVGAAYLRVFTVGEFSVESRQQLLHNNFEYYFFSR